MKKLLIGFLAVSTGMAYAFTMQAAVAEQESLRYREELEKQEELVKQEAVVKKAVKEVVKKVVVNKAVEQLETIMKKVKNLEKVMENIKTDDAGDNLFHYMVRDYKATKNQHLVGELLDVLKAVNKRKLKNALNQRNEKRKDPSRIAKGWMKIEVGSHN